jgi:capsular exopolysaccharide synthesis family protein
MNAEDLFRVLWARRLTFALVFVLTMVGVTLTTFLLPRVYRGEAHLVVGLQREGRNDFESTQISQTLTRTYVELLQNRALASRTARRLPFEMSGEAVEGAVSVSTVTQSQLLRVEAEAESPTRAKTIANTYATVAVQRVRSSFPRETPGRLIFAEPAVLPSGPSRPQPRLYLLIGAALAMSLGAAAALLRHRFERRPEILPSTTEFLGYPVLGRIPSPATSSLSALLRRDDGSGEGSDMGALDAFRALFVNLSFGTDGEGGPRSVAMVSAEQGEGKSICSLGLARAANDLDKPALLIDADLRRGGLSEMLFGTRRRRPPGLSDLLSGVDAVGVSEMIVRASDHRPDVLPCGNPAKNPTSLLGSARFSLFEPDADQSYDLLLYDTPPVSAGADASLIAASVDALLFVVDVERSHIDSVKRALAQLHRAGANVAGVVLNRVPARQSYGFYDYEA